MMMVLRLQIRGYAVSTTPAAGNSVSAGDRVTLLVSRGVDYGDSVEVPSVVGMTKNDAVTTFGKFLNVEVKRGKEYRGGRRRSNFTGTGSRKLGRSG